MAVLLLRFQQVYSFLICINKLFTFSFPNQTQAGLTCLEVIFDEGQWEEELSVLSLEEVGLGL